MAASACPSENGAPVAGGAAEYAKKAIAMGFTFVTVGGDTRFVTMGAAAAVAEMRDKPKPGASSSPY